MNQIYETMVLLDNDVVREGYEKAKSVVTDTLTKYGASIHACRRWDERRLAYPIRRKNRATYFLSYFEMPGDQIAGFRRDLDLNERVLRYLMLAVDEIPEGEVESAKVEETAEFDVPAPPEDDAVEIPEDEENEDDLDEDGERRPARRESKGAEAKSPEAKSPEAETAEAKAAPAEAQAAPAQPQEAQPTESKPAGTESEEAR